MKDPVKVMIVDDSAVVRGFLTRILSSDPGIAVVFSAHNGEMAVGAVARHKPDIVLLDVEMPVMDGLTAIPLLLAASPKSRIIMCSTLTTRNGATTLAAMQRGAVDCIAKPSAAGDIGQDDFRQQLLHKVRSIAGAGVSQVSASSALPAADSKAALLHPGLPRSVKLRGPVEGYAGKPRVLAIGSSTGGPNALFKVIASFSNFDIPIVLTQHMPPTFTRILAEHIANQTGVAAVEGEAGMPLLPGRVHVAPGGHHMRIVQRGADAAIALDDGPLENFCRPAVDPMLRSLIPVYGEKILALILTGMGQDGLRGARDLIARGGRVVAQDETTSVVWGMPGAVALDGLCSAVLPLDEIGPHIRKAVMR
jgi:two-component system, chemotaxis family, protein-glutamate methylesterase/glutaminase